MYMDNPKRSTESIKNNTKHKENIGDFDNKERCLYIYFSIANNYNLLNFIIEKNLSVPYPYISHTLQMVHNNLFSSHLCLPTFLNIHLLPTPTTRGTDTLNYPKNKTLHTTTPAPTPCLLKKLSHPIHANPTIENNNNKKKQANNYGSRTCHSGL